MKKILILILIFCFFLPGVVRANQQTTLLNPEIELSNNLYINCKSHPDYPFKTENETEPITGKINEQMGSRMYPWMAASINGHPLFNAMTGELLRNYDKLLWENVVIKGYYGEGKITMKNPVTKKKHVIKFPDAFYVTKIIGWDYICGDIVDKNGDVKAEGKCFWYPF